MSGYLDYHGFRRGKPERSRTEGPPCSECGQPMVVGQRGKHFMCDPDTLVGHRCTCRPGCTDIAVGDRGDCDPLCAPCGLKRNQDYKSVTEWK